MYLIFIKLAKLLPTTAYLEFSIKTLTINCIIVLKCI